VNWIYRVVLNSNSSMSAADNELRQRPAAMFGPVGIVSMRGALPDLALRKYFFLVI
jgi:hypothetical protein